MKRTEDGGTICEYCDKEFPDRFDILDHKCEMGYSKVTTKLYEAVEMLIHLNTLKRIDDETVDKVTDMIGDASNLLRKAYKERMKSND